MNKLAKIQRHNEVINLSSPAEEAPAAPNLFGECLRAVRNRKWTVLAFVLAGVLFATVQLIRTPPTFHSETTLEVQGLNENFMNMTAIDPQAGTGAYSPNSVNIQTQLRILESLSLIQPVIDRMERETAPALPPDIGVVAKLRKILHIGPRDPIESTRQAILMSGKTLRARGVSGTRIIAVSCQSTNPDIAASFTNALVTDYIAESSEVRSVNAQKTTQWLAAQLEETKAKLAEAESKQQEFARKAGITVAGDQQTLPESKMQVLQSNLASIQAETITKRTAWEKANAASPEALGDIVQDVELKSYSARLNDLNRERAMLLTKYTPEHEKVRELEAQIAVIQAAFDKERKNVLERYRSDYDEALERQRLMSSAYVGQATAVGAQAEKMAQYGMLKREADILRLTLNAILAQTNQASLTSALPTNSVRVVDSALPASEIFAPVARNEATKGVGLGLALGVLVALVLDKRQRKVLSAKFAEPGRSALLLNIRELGVIPKIESDRRSNGVRGLLGAGDAVLAKSRTGFMMRESFRMVVASVLRASNTEDHFRVMVVTSPGPGEGKTTVVSNLAEAMSESGKKVLVISADLRRPHLDEIFSVAGAPGLSDIVSSRDPLTAEYINSFIQRAPDSGVSVLPAGTGCADLAKLFYSAKLDVFFDSIRPNFDCIFVDTPPLLQFTESRLLGRMADGVILVLRSGSTGEADALAAGQLLLNDGIELVGTVLNDWKSSEKSPYAHYYYSAQAKS